MPGKKGKGKKGGKAKAGKVKAAEEREEAVRKTKIFLRAYQTYCAASGSVPSGRVISASRECIEEESSMTKVRKFTPSSHTASRSLQFH